MFLLSPLRWSVHLWRVGSWDFAPPYKDYKDYTSSYIKKQGIHVFISRSSSRICALLYGCVNRLAPLQAFRERMGWIALPDAMDLLDDQLSLVDVFMFRRLRVQHDLILQSFKVPWNNNFLFWYYCLFVRVSGVTLGGVWLPQDLCSCVSE
jgi:hypothetical protein